MQKTMDSIFNEISTAFLSAYAFMRNFQSKTSKYLAKEKSFEDVAVSEFKCNFLNILS